MVYKNSLFPGKPAFQSNKQMLNAGDYIGIKGSTTTFCNPTCPSGKLIGTCYNQLYSLRTSTLTKRNICKPSFNTSDLNINLFTKMNLKDVTVINENGIIDPSGVLFGNTECGMNNFENFIVPYYPSLNV
jgi:hypothetical protein